MKPTDKLPVLSGDFDSPELTENQSRLLDILKGVGKLSLIASESNAIFTTERPDGLQSFLRKVQERVDAGQPMKRDEIEELEKKVRYHEQQEKLGNKTEFLRVLLGNLHQNPQFKQFLDEVVKEQIDLSRKRADIRSLAENKFAKDLGV